uniref:BHLH domain-containing protein n=1 Tax=Salix viminalis TaxID=40686 RepID=A0A6N2MT88_SALVM
MEPEDFDSSFVFNGDPAIQLFPLVSGNDRADRTTTFNSSVFSDVGAPATAPPVLNSAFSDGGMPGPSLPSYYYCSSNDMLASVPPPPGTTSTTSYFTNLLNEDGDNYYYYSSPASEQLGYGNPFVAAPQLSPPQDSAQPYDFFSPVALQPLESTQPHDFFSPVPNEAATRPVLNDPQTLESVLGKFNAVTKKPKRSGQMKKPKRSAFDYGIGTGSSSSSASVLTKQRIAERVKCLRKVMPWITTKMDTATVLEEACKYIMNLQEQVRALEQSRPPATSFDHYNNFVHDAIDGGGGGGGGGGGEGVVSREQIMEMVFKANVDQNFKDWIT